MAHFVPLMNTPSAMETARDFVKEIVRLHGIPTNIIFNRGIQFTSRFWKALCEVLKIDLSMYSAYHPQTNGQTERTNQTLEQYLHCLTTFVQDDWVTLLPQAEFAFNNANHSPIGQSPFFTNYALLKPTVPDPFSDRGLGPPETITVSGNEEYEVAAVLDCRRRGNQLQYLIK